MWILLKLTGLFLFVSTCNAAFYWPAIPPTPENVLKLGLRAPSGSGPQCNDVLLLHCQNNFNTFLGISGHADWHTPLDLYTALLKIYEKNGTSGILQVCQYFNWWIINFRAYQQFAQCLGPSYAACNNPLFYLQHGYSILSATLYPAVIAQLRFQCGAGLQTALYNWNCIQSTGHAYNQTIVNCHVNYAVNTSADPAHACTYAAKDMYCNSAPFRQLCNPSVAWYICEYTRVGLTAHLPTCNLRCRVSGNSMDDAFEKEEETLDTNEHEKVVEQPEDFDNLDFPHLNGHLRVFQQIAEGFIQA